MADYVAYFNGEFVPFSQVKIDPLDRGFLVGDCVFDVARTFNGKSFRMREHVDRLYRSLKYVRIDPGLTPDELERISEEVISRNEHLRARRGRLPALAVRHPRARPLGAQGRAPRRGHLHPADGLRPLRRPLRHGRPRGRRPHAQLQPRRARPEGEELQPHELQPGRARGLRRRPRGVAHPARQPGQPDRGRRLQPVPGVGRRDPDGGRPQRPPGDLARDGLRPRRGSWESRSPRRISSRTTSTRPTRRSSRARARASFR